MTYVAECRNVLAGLAACRGCYMRELFDAGLECCGLVDGWISENCSKHEYAAHRRVSDELAAESMRSARPELLLRDDYILQSEWLNSLKTERLANFGACQKLLDDPRSQHLVELSPGMRLYMQSLEPSVSKKKGQVHARMLRFERARTSELLKFGSNIEGLLSRLPENADEIVLQRFFSEFLKVKLFASGAMLKFVVRRNQILGRDEKVVALTFSLANDYVLALVPMVIGLSNRSGGFSGTLGVGFRILMQSCLEDSRYIFNRETYLSLQELFPNGFNDYGLFSSEEELCLNMLAWDVALNVVISDIIKALRSVKFT